MSFWHKSAFIWHKSAAIACQSGARAAVAAFLRQFSPAAWIRLDLIELRLKQIQSSNSNLRSKIRVFVRRLKFVRRKYPPKWVSWGNGDSGAQHSITAPQHHSTAQQCTTAKHSTAQHSTAQHSTTQHSTAQHSTAQHSSTAQGVCLCVICMSSDSEQLHEGGRVQCILPRYHVQDCADSATALRVLS